MEENSGPGYWAELKTKLKQKYPQLMPADFRHRQGEEERMLRVIEYKLRKSKAEMKVIITAL